MRFPMTIRVFVLVAVAGVCVSAAEKTRVSPAPVAPKQGVKTPGVQISFESLKPELEFVTPEAPGWIAFAENVIAPKSDGLVRIDPRSKESKLIDPIAGVAKPCGGLVNALGALWVPACGEGGLAKVDTKAAKVTATVKTGTGSVRGSI